MGGLTVAETSFLVPYQKAGETLGDGVASGAAAIARAVQSGACALYQGFPGFITGGQFDNPMSDLNDSFMDNLCRPTGQLPPPKASPFDGGQCLCRNYTVTMSITITGSGTNPNFQLSMFGPIVGIAYEDFTNASGQPARNAYLVGSSASCQGGAKREALFGGAPVTSTATITSVTPVDGLADSCGNPAPRYPISQPSANSLTVNVPITLSPNVNIIAPITIFAPITNFSPQVKVGPVNVDIGLGGLTLDFDPTINLPGTNPVPTTPPKPGPGNSQQERDCDFQLDEVLRYLKRLRECQECDRDYDFLSTGVVSGVSGSVSVPAGGIPLAAVLTITKSPVTKRSQPGLTEPDVLYGGWGWWEGNGYLGDRLPVDAASKIFDAPTTPSLPTFRFTVYTGFEASIQMTYKRLKNPLPSV